MVLEPRVLPAFAITYFCNHCNIRFENTSKYVDTLTLFSKNLNQRSLTPRWPLTPCLLRSHVWLYPRIIVSKSHDNTSMYVDTVINFAKYHIHTYTYYVHTTYYVQNELSHSLLLNSVQARQKLRSWKRISFQISDLEAEILPKPNGSKPENVRLKRGGKKKKRNWRAQQLTQGEKVRSPECWRTSNHPTMCVVRVPLIPKCHFYANLFQPLFFVDKTFELQLYIWEIHCFLISIGISLIKRTNFICLVVFKFES